MRRIDKRISLISLASLIRFCSMMSIIFPPLGIFIKPTLLAFSGGSRIIFSAGRNKKPSCVDDKPAILAFDSIKKTYFVIYR